MAFAALPEMEEALPDLHSGLQREVLLRVPYKFHQKFKTVCRSWETMMNITKFYEDRKVYGKSEQLICLTNNSFEEIEVYDPLKGTWERIPRIPDFPHFYPLAASTEFASVNGKLVLLGGRSPLLFRAFPTPTNMVFIYDFKSSKWSRGAYMPTTRVRFACSVCASKGLIYVAGGCDEYGNILATAEVYDVEADKWEVLPPMPQRQRGYGQAQRERWYGQLAQGQRGYEKSIGVFINGKFIVISGSSRDHVQLHTPVETSAEVFDTHTSTWNTMEDIWTVEMRSLDCYHICLYSIAGDFYVIDWGQKVMRKYDAHKAVWTSVPSFPQHVPVITCVAPWRDQIFVSGTDLHGGYPISYLFQPSTGESTVIDAPQVFQRAAVVEI